MNFQDILKSLLGKPTTSFFIGIFSICAFYFSFLYKEHLGTLAWTSIATFTVITCVIAWGIALGGIWTYCTQLRKVEIAREENEFALTNLSTFSKNILMGMISSNRRTVDLAKDDHLELVDNGILKFKSFGREKDFCTYRVTDNYWPLISQGKYKLLYRGRHRPSNKPSTYGFKRNWFISLISKPEIPIR